MPAQFTTISTRPNLASTCLANRRDRVFLRHVADDRERLPPGGFDEFDGLASVGEIGDGDMRAVFGEAFGKSLADAVGAAGDDGDFVLMPFAHETPP